MNKDHKFIVIGQKISIQLFVAPLFKTWSEFGDLIVFTEPPYFQSRYVKSFQPFRFMRKPDLLRDILGFWKLFKAVDDISPKLIISIGPKLGLFNSLIASVRRFSRKKPPKSLHIFTGQVWASRKGVSRAFYKSIDKLIASSVDYAFVDGHSQKLFLEEELNLHPSPFVSIPGGGLSGVLIPELPDQQICDGSVSSEGVTKGAFIGRICKDKGIPVLTSALQVVLTESSSFKFVFIGVVEDSCGALVKSLLNAFPMQVEHIGHVDFPFEHVRDIDFVVLPSKREGYGVVVAESMSFGIPAVVSDCYGLRDVVDDGINGLAFPVDDNKALIRALRSMYLDHETRIRLGASGRTKARNVFDRVRYERWWETWMQQIVREL